MGGVGWDGFEKVQWRAGVAERERCRRRCTSGRSRWGAEWRAHAIRVGVFHPCTRKILDTHKPRMLSLCYSVRNSTLQTHPSMLPKSASGPQNHPSANVALFDLALATAGVTRGQSCFPDRAPMSLLSIRREEGAASDLGSEGGTGVERRRSTMV